MPSRFLIILWLALAFARSAFSAHEDDLSCAVAIIGAGPGGVYLAWRLALGDTLPGASICLFERADRAGGRVMTLRHAGPRGDLTVEAGAYRFNRDPMMDEWGSFVHTPLTYAIIAGGLNLSTASYAPHTPNNTMLKIVDGSGNNAGFSTFVDHMLEDAKRRKVRVFFQHELTSIGQTLPSDANRPLRLYFANGRVASVGQLLLNLPQLPLLRVLQASEVATKVPFPASLTVLKRDDGAKLYVYYDDAWWATHLGLRHGTFNFTGSQQMPPLLGRYHDGDIRCEDGNLSICHGYLEAAYVWDDVAQWFGTYVSNGHPATHLDDPGGRALLEAVHAALLQHHAAALTAANAYEIVARMRPSPEHSVLSAWNQATVGFGTGSHATLAGPISAKQAAVGALQPLLDLPIFVANEAFGTLREADGSFSSAHAFAECSLAQAENILSLHFGLPCPDWIDEDIYAARVLYSARTDRFRSAEAGRAGGRQEEFI